VFGPLGLAASATCSAEPTTSLLTVCFSYNPDALTNACLQTSDTTQNVPVPTVGTEPTPETVPIVTVGTAPDTVCIIGPVCETVPTPTVTPGSTTVDAPTPVVGSDNVPITVPTPGGYVEITAACGLNVPCRVTL
jgi:hypothetical protein